MQVAQHHNQPVGSHKQDTYSIHMFTDEGALKPPGTKQHGRTDMDAKRLYVRPSFPSTRVRADMRFHVSRECKDATVAAADRIDRWAPHIRTRTKASVRSSRRDRRSRAAPSRAHGTRPAAREHPTRHPPVCCHLAASDCMAVAQLCRGEASSVRAREAAAAEEVSSSSVSSPSSSSCVASPSSSASGGRGLPVGECGATSLRELCMLSDGSFRGVCSRSNTTSSWCSPCDALLRSRSRSGDSTAWYQRLPWPSRTEQQVSARRERPLHVYERATYDHSTENVAVSISATSCEHEAPATSDRLIAVEAMIVERYVRYVLPRARSAGSLCGPKTKTACEACRSVTEQAYESVQQSVGAHQTPAGISCAKSRSIISCAALQREPDTAKKRKRGGFRPHTTHDSASALSGSDGEHAAHIGH
mmetsp:Transcript_51583/g.118477  ORF Transcript_51583/g.118477 Transcript_51583/m.118477 type:complete len:418 (-) Transcript_51583:120-1373(-)